MKEYLVIYDFDNHIIFIANNIKDCIIHLARHTGDYTELFEKAIKGLNEDKDCIELYNRLCACEIEYIYKIEEKIYPAN